MLIMEMNFAVSLEVFCFQVTGIRFMWENIIQSISRVKSGDKGLGCILAHTMGLGKTFQVLNSFMHESVCMYLIIFPIY